MASFAELQQVLACSSVEQAPRVAEMVAAGAHVEVPSTGTSRESVARTLRLRARSPLEYVRAKQVALLDDEQIDIYIVHDDSVTAAVYVSEGEGVLLIDLIDA